MTSHLSHRLLVLTVLQHVSADRLQRAATALADGSITITPTRTTPADIRALVKTGEGQEYGCTITEGVTTCSCKDALYRGVICKHVTDLLCRCSARRRKNYQLTRFISYCAGLRHSVER